MTGCNFGCRSVRRGWYCTKVVGLKSDCLTRTGDGIKVGSEECDDENTKSEDGCSSTGKIEDGWSCTED
jgi:cysteine-rich repeat protein